MLKEDTLKPLGGQCPKCLKQKVQCICHTMFKVGDWVKVKGTLESDIFKLTENEIKYKEIILGHFIFEENTWVHWQPKEGEWCWFYSSYDSNPLLGKFERYDEYSKYYQLDISKYGKHSHPSNHRFNYCEPFIGELPSFIKDRQ